MATEVDDFLREGALMPYGSERVRLHAEAVRVADLHQDLEAGFKARQQLIQSANLGGDPNLALVAFAWCLGQHDADPKRFPANGGGYFTNLLWMYKWVVERAIEHPAISRAKVDELLADMARRYTAGGFSLRPVRKLELQSAVTAQEAERIPAAMAEWLRLRRDSLSDCMACDVDMTSAAHLATHDLKLAREAAKPIFELRMTCAEVPTVTYGRFLLPLSRSGDDEEAQRLAHLLPRKIGINRDYVTPAGALVVYLVERRSRPALPTAQRHATWALVGETPLRRVTLMIGLAKASRLARDMGRGEDSLGILLPNEPATSFAEAEERMTQEAMKVAAAFDARNGHDRFSSTVSKHLAGDGEWWWPL